MSNSCSSVKESFPIPVRIAAERSGLISVTPRSASLIALGISFDTVPLRGEGINFLGPRIYTLKTLLLTYSSNRCQLWHIPRSSQQNIKIDLSRLNVVDYIINSNNISSTVFCIRSVLSICNNANTWVLPCSMWKLLMRIAENRNYREQSANNHVSLLWIDIQICCYLKCFIKLRYSTISYTGDRLHRRIILWSDFEYCFIIPDDWDVSWPLSQMMRNNAAVGVYRITS